jgi:hypothetical protein
LANKEQEDGNNKNKNKENETTRGIFENTTFH